MGTFYSSPMVAMIKLSEASVIMWVIVKVSRTPASETSTLYEHLRSVMSGR